MSTTTIIDGGPQISDSEGISIDIKRSGNKLFAAYQSRGSASSYVIKYAYSENAAVVSGHNWKINIVHSVMDEDLGYTPSIVVNDPAVFIAYLSLLCNTRYTAFQYALLSSFMAFARTWLSSPSGWVVDSVNWESTFSFFNINVMNLEPLQMSWIGFFIFTAIAAIPGLVLLILVGKKRIREK